LTFTNIIANVDKSRGSFLKKTWRRIMKKGVECLPMSTNLSCLYNALAFELRSIERQDEPIELNCERVDVQLKLLADPDSDPARILEEWEAEEWPDKDWR